MLRIYTLAVSAAAARQDRLVGRLRGLVLGNLENGEESREREVGWSPVNPGAYAGSAAAGLGGPGAAVELFERSKTLNLLNRWHRVEALNFLGSRWGEAVCGEV